MKKALKFLLPVMVIALLVGALCIFASAETAEAKPTFRLTYKDGTFVDHYETGLNAVTLLDNVTVDILQDIDFSNGSSTASIQLKGDVTVNFNGHTLSSNLAGNNNNRFSIYSTSYSGPWNITFNGGSSATDKTMGTFNGKNLNGQKFYIDKAAAKVTYNNLEFAYSSTHSFFDLRAGTHVYNNCIFTQDNDSVFVNTAGSDGSNVNVTLDGCTVNGYSKQTTSFFQQGRSDSTKTKASLTVKNSVLNLPSTAGYLIKNRYQGTGDINSNYNHSASFINTVINAPNTTVLTWMNDNCWTSVTIGEGTVLNVKALMGKTTNTSDKNYVKLADGLEKTAYDLSEQTDINFKAVKPEDVVTVTFTHNGETLGTRKMARGVAPAFNKSFTSDFYYEGTSYMLDIHDGWADESGKVTALLKDSELQSVTLSAYFETKTVYYAVYDSKGDMVFFRTSPNLTDLTDITGTPAGGTFRLYADVNFSELKYAGSGNDPQSFSFNNAGCIMDLNGYTLDFSADYYNTSLKKTTSGAFRFSGNGKAASFKNGKIVNSGTVFYIDTTNTNYTFEGVTIENTLADGGTITDLRRGTLTYEDCTLICTGRAFSIAYRGGSQNLTLNNTDVTARYLLGTNPPKDNTIQATTKVTVKGGELDLGAILYSNDVSSDNSTGLLESSTLDLTLSDAKVKLNSGFEMNADFTETITFSNCLFNKDPFDTDSKVTPNVVLADGETLVKTSDDVYGYKVTKINLSVSANLTLYSDFNLNLFLGNNATKVTVGETELTLEEYDATKVKASLKSIAPNTAADNIVFAISYVEDGVTYTANFNYSVVKYATTLLAGGYSAESKALVASAVKYIDTAYAAAKAEKPATLTALTASANYTAAIATASDLAKGDIDGAGNYTALAVAINSAQLRLTDDYKYVLNLKETYTGTLKVNNVTYNVVNGTVNGKTYVTVTLRGYEFNDGLTVTATNAEGTVEGVYTLADYVEAMANGTDADLDALLVALYNFTVEAKEYNEFVKANGLK